MMGRNLWEAPGNSGQMPGYQRVIARQPHGSLPQNILAFCKLLRKRGFLVGVGEAMEILTILPQADLLDWNEFYLLLRSFCVSRHEELRIFDALFHSFWTGWGGIEQLSHHLFEVPPEHSGRRSSNRRADQSAAVGAAKDDAKGSEEVSLPLYSPEEILAKRFFLHIEQDELRGMEAKIKALGKRLATRPGRRVRPSRKGHMIDVRRSMRRNLGVGGEIVSLSRRRRSLRRLKLVLLLDVSRSMDVYSQFLLKLIYSLHFLRGRADSFVFGTDLKRVTACFKSTDINSALASLSREVPFWSGGTRIGHCFRLFNLKYAQSALTGQSVLVILSDGLDTEASDLVAEELAIMKQKVSKLIWLNPLADTPGYEPLAGSMAAALPHIDLFTSTERLLSGRGDSAV
jgi:uncharacterized protein